MGVKAERLGLRHDLPESARRRMAAVTPAGVVLELDRLPGVVAAYFYSAGDHGEPGYVLPPGEEVIEVVTTGHARDVWAHLATRMPSGVLAVPMVRPPRWFDRWIVRKRWREWRRNEKRVERANADAARALRE